IEIDPGRPALEVRPQESRLGRKISTSEPPKWGKQDLNSADGSRASLERSTAEQPEIYSTACLAAVSCSLLATRYWMGAVLEAGDHAPEITRARLGAASAAR